MFDDIRKAIGDAADAFDVFIGKAHYSSSGAVHGGGGRRHYSIPQFAIGGFPEDGLFMANHNELVGQFSNGKTAVANNQQITDGIAIAVQNANSEQNELLRQQNELLRAILQKPTLGNDDVFNAARAVYKDKAIRRYGNSSAYDPVWG